jgi:hypothetical protein
MKKGYKKTIIILRRSCKKSVLAILFATILGYFPPAGGKR